jgi:cyclomaltodextrinase / maltogenic alpha-amylase / neopullulanase
MTGACGRRSIAAILLLATGGCAGHVQTPVVSFATTGGDAWTFTKRLDASAAAGACDAVSFTSPVARVVARSADGRHFSADLPLDEDDNLVTAQCRKAGSDQGPPAQEIWHVRRAAAPYAAIRVDVHDRNIILDARSSRAAPARPAPIISYAWTAVGSNPAPIAGLPKHGSLITLRPPRRDGDYEIRLRISDAAGRNDETVAGLHVHRGRVAPIHFARAAPDWIKHAAIYGIDPFVFPNHDFAGIAARIDVLMRLGINTLWLSPVTASAPEDFGYAATDLFRLRQTFGSEDDLRRLIEAAHARRMKVILDFVANHLSDQSAYFADATMHGHRSPYFDYFVRNAAEEAEHYFDWRNLENLNYDNPEVQNLVIDAFIHWLRAFDVDGFRVDAAWGPAQRAPTFWPRWRAALKHVKPDILLLAEAPAYGPYATAEGFDAAYDWTEQLGKWAWQGAFDDPADTARRLRHAIAASLLPSLPPVLRFLDNNDTGPRFITRYGLARTRVAAAMLLTLPGVPELYSGDEVGAAFEPYRTDTPIAWQDRYGLEPWYRRLLALRREQPALTSRRFKFLSLPPQDRLLAYERPGTRGTLSILVLLNYGSTPLHVALPANIARGQIFVDLLRGGRVRLDRSHSMVRVSGNDVRIFGYRPYRR